MAHASLLNWARSGFHSRPGGRYRPANGAPAAARRRSSPIRLEVLEDRMLLSTTTVNDVQGAPGTRPPVDRQEGPVILVSPTVRGRADLLLDNSFALRPLSAQADRQPAPVIVTAAQLHRPAVIKLLKRSYAAGQTVALTNATGGAVQTLERELKIASLAELPPGTRRVALISFRTSNQPGQSGVSTSILMHQDNTPAAKESTQQLMTAKQEANQTALAFLTKAFDASPVVVTQEQGSASQLSLTQIAEAYQESVLNYNAGAAVQIVNTVFDARSFTNKQDLYYVQQEVDCTNYQYPVDSGTWDVGIFNRLEAPQGLVPMTLQPGPQSNPQTTTVTSGVSKTIAGSIGWNQSQGFNASFGYSVTIANTRSTVVPPIEITYQGDPRTGESDWNYAQPGSILGLQTTSLYNQWIWAIPFSQYPASTPQISFLSDAKLFYRQNGIGYGVNAKLSNEVPLPLGSTFTLTKPTVAGVSMKTVQPGDLFTIEGQALYPSLIQGVFIGGQPVNMANVAPLSDTEIQVLAPDTPGDRPQSVVVRTNQGFSNNNVEITIEHPSDGS